MIQIKIADTQFAHGTSLGSGDLKIYPKFFKWYRGAENINDMVVITESMFHMTDQFTEKIKIAWLLEPVSINSQSYKWIEENWQKFKYILSHNLEFIDKMKRIIQTGNNDQPPKICWYPFGGCWIMPEDRKIYPKTKLISIIASGKTETEGHKLRHEVIKALGSKVDVYGRGYTPVEYKLDALKDYQYSIVIENEKTKGFFTEKLIDCLVTGTIPIFWGDPGFMDKHTNDSPTPNYIFIELEQRFSTIEQLEQIVNGIIYGEFIAFNTEFIEMLQTCNFEAAKHYTCPEDWLYRHFFLIHNDLKDQLIKYNIL